MNIRLFNRKYKIRRFEGQQDIKGYLVNAHTDKMFSIHVHPVGGNTIKMDINGETLIRNLEGHGEVQLYSADQRADHKADLLLYEGHWYECKSCVYYKDTLLRHYNYTFQLIPNGGSGTIDI